VLIPASLPISKIVAAINLLLSPFPNPPFSILQDNRELVNGKNLGNLTLGGYYHF
jgi:hypothetical protein